MALWKTASDSCWSVCGQRWYGFMKNSIWQLLVSVRSVTDMALWRTASHLLSSLHWYLKKFSFEISNISDNFGVFVCVCVCVTILCLDKPKKSGPSKRNHAVRQRVTSCPGSNYTKAYCQHGQCAILLLWQFHSSQIWCSVVTYAVPDVSNERIATTVWTLKKQDCGPWKRRELLGHTIALQNTRILSNTALGTSYFWDIRSTLQCSYWKIDDDDDKNDHDENNNKCIIIIIIIIIVFAFRTRRAPQKYIT